jgi:hypothetical protein
VRINLTGWHLVTGLPSTKTFLTVCLVFGLSACQSYMAAQAARPQPLPRLPVQPAEVPNLNQSLLGQWSATYPGGPLRVSIQDDPMLFGTNYVATLVDGGYGTFHAGAVVFRATPDQAAPNLAAGTQICPDPGHFGPIQVQMTITVIDSDHFTEELADRRVCKGFPVKFTRIAASR